MREGAAGVCVRSIVESLLWKPYNFSWQFKERTSGTSKVVAQPGLAFPALLRHLLFVSVTFGSSSIQPSPGIVGTIIVIIFRSFRANCRTVSMILDPFLNRVFQQIVKAKSLTCALLILNPGPPTYVRVDQLYPIGVCPFRALFLSFEVPRCMHAFSTIACVDNF